MTSGGLNDLFPFLFPSGRGFAMPLTGYFDESDRRDGREPICVGGFLFQPSGYKAFHAYWQRNVLRQRGRRVDPFHMTDLCAGHEVYEGLSIADRIAILTHAVHAISRNAYAAIGVHFDQAEFIRKAPVNWPDVFGSIYTVACHMCLQTTSHWLDDWNPNQKVAYVFERGHKFQHEADELLKAIAGNKRATKAFRYRQHLFEPKTEFGLQAADLYSWFITKASVSDGNTPNAVKPFLSSLRGFFRDDVKHDRYKIHSYTGEKLDRFIESHLNGESEVFLFKRLNNRRRAFR